MPMQDFKSILLLVVRMSVTVVRVGRGESNHQTADCDCSPVVLTILDESRNHLPVANYERVTSRRKKKRDTRPSDLIAMLSRDWTISELSDL